MRILYRTLILLFYVFPASIYSQGKIILVTDDLSNWSITKYSQPYPTNTLPESTPWLTDQSPGVINSDWTNDVKIANIAGSQISIIDDIGNNAKPIWIAKDLCNYSDNSVQPQTYNFRNTFFIENCAEITQAQIQYSADNSCRIYINGKQIISNNGLYQYEGYNLTCDNSCGVSINEYSENLPASNFNCRGFNTIEVANIAHLLTSGINVIAVENLNTGGCAVNYGWICMNMEIIYADEPISAQVSDVVHKTCNRNGSFSIAASGGSGIYTYEISDQLKNDDGIFNNMSPGTYEVKVTDENGCSVYVEVVLIEDYIIPQLIVSNLDNVIDCGDQNSSITASGVGGDELKYILDNNQPSDIGFFDNIDVGSHTLYVINEQGCISDTFNFEVYSYPGYFLRLIESELCEGDSVSFFGKSYQTTGLFFDTLSSPDNLCDTLIRIDLKLKTIQELVYQVELCHGESVFIGNETYNKSGQFYQTIYTSSGCDSLLNISISIRDEKKLSLTLMICEGDTIRLGDYDYNIIGNYEQIYQSENGCDSLLEIRVEYKDKEVCENGICGKYFVPNVFTPNNDGKNDFFEVNVKDVIITYMAIYDRWGDVVYTSSQINPKWNGMFESYPAASGVYVYMIRGHCVNNVPIFKYGDVTLVR